MTFDFRLFAKVVKSVRKSRRLTSAELADACGITRSTLHRIEKGMMKPSVESLYRIAVELNLEFNDFIEDEKSVVINVTVDPFQSDPDELTKLTMDEIVKALREHEE